MIFRVAPKAVCRQLLANLKTHKPLTSVEEARILDAIENSRVPDAANRLIADLSRSALKTVLDKI